MKKTLFSILVIVLCWGSTLFQAQGFREISSQSQKSDDGILVAYSNSARDIIILKSKDTGLRIRSVTFYSILGVEVMMIPINAHSGEIRLDKLRPGKYLMRYVMSNNTQKVVQIIKQ